ncbi:MAG TPA: hypothetical protein VKZ48_04575 [Burkholderiales bacterium]|nr:hypothetical protein [Burkholderiales bacterium]
MMKRLLVLVGMLCTLVAAYPAAAERNDYRHDPRYERNERRDNGRSDWRDGRNSREQAGERRDRGGRMSPDERRQLRRDIQDHGRDVYRERGRRGRNGG